jgi:hypothetical protein
VPRGQRDGSLLSYSRIARPKLTPLYTIFFWIDSVHFVVQFKEIFTKIVIKSLLCIINIISCSFRSQNFGSVNTVFFSFPWLLTEIYDVAGFKEEIYSSE